MSLIVKNMPLIQVPPVHVRPASTARRISIIGDLDASLHGGSCLHLSLFPLGRNRRKSQTLRKTRRSQQVGKMQIYSHKQKISVHI